jgi:hypothetical protein
MNPTRPPNLADVHGIPAFQGDRYDCAAEHRFGRRETGAGGVYDGRMMGLELCAGDWL